MADSEQPVDRGEEKEDKSEGDRGFYSMFPDAVAVLEKFFGNVAGEEGVGGMAAYEESDERCGQPAKERDGKRLMEGPEQA